MGTAQFLAKKEKYLDDHIIKITYGHYPARSRVADFLLVKEPSGHGGPKTYVLKQRTQQDGDKGPWITAAWLPYFQWKVEVIDLADPAFDNVEYFFTAELTGCRLEIGTADRPTVLHIAGDVGMLYQDVPYSRMTEGQKAEVTARMDEEAADVFKDRPRRKFSKGTGYPGADSATVVGFRRGTRWEFWAQQHTGDTFRTIQCIRQIVTIAPNAGTA